MKTNSEENRIDIHNTEQTLETEWKLLEDCDILPENKKLIKAFVEEYGHNLSAMRKSKYLIKYRNYGKLLGKSFLKVNRKDIQKLEKSIEDSHPLRWSNKKRKWIFYPRQKSPETIRDEKKLLRLLYKWLTHSYLKHKKKEDRQKGKTLRDKLKVKSVPELVEDVVGAPTENGRLKSKDMLTWEEVVQLSQNTNNPRDKAIIQVLGETGLRAGEFLTLQIQDVDVKDLGGKVVGVIHVRQSKTDERSIGIVNSVPALLEYLKSHPARKVKNAPLWIMYANRYHYSLGEAIEYMSYDSLRYLLIEAKRRCGIDKLVNPHHFRKSRASFLAHCLSEQEIKNFLGWAPDSRVLKHYMFVDQEKTNESYWKSQGVEIEDGKPKDLEKIKPVKCECGHINPAGDIFCNVCSRPLNEDNEEYKKLDLLIERMIERKLGMQG